MLTTGFTGHRARTRAQSTPLAPPCPETLTCVVAFSGADSARAIQAPHEDACGELKVFERHVSTLSTDGGGSWTAVGLGQPPLHLVLVLQTVFVSSSQQVRHVTRALGTGWAHIN